MDNEKSVHLTDLIDADVLQQLQNAFSDLMGMASLTSDRNGVAVTEGSNFTDFCFKYTRPTELGRKRCEQCDKHGAELTLANGSSCSYYCHAGLMDFAAPIMANGEMVGSFIGGQVLTSPPDIQKIRETAKELGIDPDEYEEAVKKVPVVSEERVEKASHFLYVFAAILSNIAYKGYALRQSNMALEKASHMKSDFLANMSHEIRTPMNAVLGLADLALREEMSASAREYLHQIKASSKNLLVIINDILDFSKIESGKMDINETEYEPLSLINDLTSIVNSRIGSKEIEFTMDISPDVPKCLYGDSVRIHQIVLNLLTNAVKFTHHGEVHLKIDFELNGEDTAVMKAEISDTGIGIKKEDMQKLFNSFQQVDSKRNRNIEGTGLGLAISRQLLDLMGGKISVESEYEKGTTFFFEVPQKIVDPTPIVPKLEKKLKTAILISNSFVKAQLIRDLTWIGSDYTDLADRSTYNDLQTDYLIVEKPYFNQTIRNYISRCDGLQCLVMGDYDSIEPINIPNVRVISKPVYSLSLYNAMGIQEINLNGDMSSESDSFTFIAPDAHILIVDDNTVNLTVAKGLLEPIEMHIDVASSAAEAVEKIHYVNYDIIFMDHMMPEVDGIEATHIIRQLVPDYNDVPIIALTANAIGGAREMFLKEGMNDFIAKPIDIKIAVSKLRKWLPKEKIIPADKANTSRHSAEQDISDYVNIKELNTKEAISRLGSEKLFRSVLKEYFGAVDKKYKAILEHKNAGRWRDYTIEVHALKSTSRQIGAEHLSEMAAEMEKAGNDLNIDLINEKTGAMLEEYLKLKEILKPCFAEKSKSGERVAQCGEILNMLEKMQEALAEYDTLQIDEVIEEMSGFKYSADDSAFYEKLKEAAEISDIDKCLNIVGEWGKALVNSVSDGDKVFHMLGDLQNALDKFDTLELDGVIEKMTEDQVVHTGIHKAYFQQLQKAAQNGDFDKCTQIVEYWSKAIVEIY